MTDLIKENPQTTQELITPQSQKNTPRNRFKTFKVVVSLTASITAVLATLVIAGNWAVNKMIEYGRQIEKDTQLQIDKAELKSTKDSLMAKSDENTRLQAELNRSNHDRDSLTQENKDLRISLEQKQEEIIQLHQKLAANDNCAFIHRQIEMAQQAVDQHQPFVVTLDGPSPEYLRKHQILINRLNVYQEQLGQCRGVQ